MNHDFSFSPQPIRRRAAQRAATLPATLLVVAAVVTFLSLAATLTSQFGRYAGRQQGNGMEAAFCDAALEYAFATWRDQMKLSPTIQPTAAAITAKLDKVAFVSTIFPYASQLGIDTSNWTLEVQAIDQNGQNKQNLSAYSLLPASSATDKNVAPPKTSTKNVPGYPGWTGFTFNYLAKVSVTSTRYGMTTGETYSAQRYFQVTKVPLCQAVAFYEGNLEIHPGADMYLNGPVHSNGSIWVQAMGIGLKLQFLNNVSYVGTFNDGIGNPAVKNGWTGSDVVGSANPDAYKPYSPTRYSDGGASTAYAGGSIAGLTYPAVPASTTMKAQVNKVAVIDPFGGATTSNNGLRDIIEVPATTNTSDQIAYNNANVVVTVNSASLVKDLLGNLTQIPTTAVTVQVRDASTGVLGAANSTDYSAVLGAINNANTVPMYDKRESATAYTTALDMTKFDAATTMPSDTSKATPMQKAFNQATTQGGTVYIHDTSGRTGGSRGAIRLVNGRNLGQNVSVASENAIYIQGDYNTGGKSASDVPSDGSNATITSSPQATGYSRYAASVMADAVTVLSNNWKDTNASTAINTRMATATTVNAAILAGDVASNTNSSGIASGGVHNFPRFLENWTGVNFTYYGSLIEAFNSEQYTGYWQTNDVYTWPNRLWNFDSNFLDQQPPGLPQGVQYTRGRWERRFDG